jgi:hypothetical protein
MNRRKGRYMFWRILRILGDGTLLLSVSSRSPSRPRAEISVLEQVQPDAVIMSSKAPEALIEKVTAWCKLLVPDTV